VDPGEIDLLDLDCFEKGVPHEWFSWLRKHAPVYFHPEPDGKGFWVLSKYEDVVAIGRDARRFSSDQRLGGVFSLEDLEIVDWGEGQLMLTMDPPAHTRYRRLVNRGFTPRTLAALEPKVRDITSGILDAALKKAEVDFVIDVAKELPLQVIADIIGVPEEDRRQLFEWSNRLIGSDDPEYAVAGELVTQAQIEMFMYAQSLAERKRARPADDIASDLLAADVDGDALSDMDFNLFFLLLVVAGNETTRNALSHAINAFVENPVQYRLLCSNPEAIPQAVEEVLRWASPVMFFRRNVTCDLDYKGHALRQGDKVSIWYVSANRDEDVFEDPFRFDVTRRPNEHLAFGGGGPHHCLGANLARLEIKVFLEELVHRVARVEALGEPAWLRSNFIRGIKHLPVRLERVSGRVT